MFSMAKNFGSQSQRPVTKKFWNWPIMFGFGHSLSIANNFVIGVYCRCLEILSQIAFSSIANYFRIYRKKQFGIESVGIYSRHQ